MLSKLYLARTSDPALNHHGLLDSPLPPRTMNKDLVISCEKKVEAAKLMTKDTDNGKLVAKALQTMMASKKFLSMKSAVIMGGRFMPVIQI